MTDSPLATESPVEQSIAAIIEKVIHPSRFFVAPGIQLRWIRGIETVAWEMFRGSLLDERQTRERQTFASWSVIGPDDDEPWLSIKWHRATATIHVTRSIRCHAHEAYEQNGVIQARPVIRRVRELVGSLSLSRLSALSELPDELATLMVSAVVGTHRLPVTSLETPMPEFSLGLFSYDGLGSGDSQPTADTGAWLSRIQHTSPDDVQAARLLEFALRGTPPHQLKKLTNFLTAEADLSKRLRLVMLHVSLTPYLDFTTKVWQLTDAMLDAGRISAEQRLDLFCWVLRLVARHLTSFDLVEFHHRGANYPDALLIDELAGRLTQTLSKSLEFFLDLPTDDNQVRHRKRLRRRAIRQTWLLRRENAGRRVPPHPASPGDMLRVFPPWQNESSADSKQHGEWSPRRLFADLGILDASMPVVACVLRASVEDLVNEMERRELGLGLFLDRPLGWAKQGGEPDRTLMLAHECYSPAVAARRADALRSFASYVPPPLETVGVPWRCRTPRRRPGVVSLQDMQLSPHEFRLVRTTRSSRREFWLRYAIEGEAAASPRVNRLQAESTLIVPSPERPDELLFLDEGGRCRLRGIMVSSEGYRLYRGHEYLAGGIEIIDASDADGRRVDEMIGASIKPRLHPSSGRTPDV